MKIRWQTLVALGSLAVVVGGCGPQPMGDEKMPETTPGREPMAATGGVAPAAGGGPAGQPAGQPGQQGTTGAAGAAQPTTE